MKWEFEFVLKEERKGTLLFFPRLLSSSQWLNIVCQSCGVLFFDLGFFLFYFISTKNRITFELMPSMNVFSVLLKRAPGNSSGRDLFGTVKLASPDTNRITHHSDE